MAGGSSLLWEISRAPQLTLPHGRGCLQGMWEKAYPDLRRKVGARCAEQDPGCQGSPGSQRRIFFSEMES